MNPFKDALAKLRQRAPVGADLSSSQWADVPLALRERAFFSARVANVQYAQQLKDLAESILNPVQIRREDRVTPQNPQGFVTVGENMATAREKARAALAGFSYDPGEKAGGIQDLSSDARLNLQLKTNVESAQGFGNFLQGQAEGALDAFPAQEFFRAEDREEPRNWPTRWMQAGGQIFNGRMIALKSDAVWEEISAFGTPYPPFDFNSGMWVRDIDREEAIDLGLMSETDSAEPVVEKFNAKLKSSVRNVDPDLLDTLKEQFGGDVKIEGQNIWWKGDRVPKAKPAAEPVPEPKAAPKNEFPATPAELQLVRPLGGSTGAELVQDSGGQLFVRKKGASAAHVREEVGADDVYRALGVPVPEARLYEQGGRPVKLARYIDGKNLGDYLKTANAKERDAVTAELQKHFSADALVGNWDVAGMGLDNVVVDKNGKPWRIDNGGALRFRAQGTAKTADQWSDFPTELWTMRDAAANPQAAKLFDKVSIYDIARQVQSIDGAAALAAAPAEARAVLAARLENLRAVSRKALEYEGAAFKAPYADQVTRHIVGIRKAGVMDGVATELTQGHPGDVRPVDSYGVAFDRLRTPKDVAKADPSAEFYDSILPAVKTVNGHHLKGDLNYNASTLGIATGKKPALEQLLASGSANEKAMASHYLDALNKIQAAQGNVAQKVAQFTKFDLPLGATSRKSRSAVADVADYMKANGGDWKVIEDWANGQGGSSSSENSKALKYWLAERLNIDRAEYHNPPTEAAFKKVSQGYGAEVYGRSMEIFHSFVQETLGRVEFPGNDTKAGLFRVLRTEATASAVSVGVGQTGEYKRGVNESGSAFTPVFSGSRTVTVVPHARVTGLYFFEKKPGTGHTFFLGDSENEVTYIGSGIKTLNLGTSKQPSLSPGKDSKKWEL